VLELAVATADRLLPAVAALAGVALTLVGAWLTERRRWRRERESAAEERRLEIRQATRLVEQELCEAEQLSAFSRIEQVLKRITSASSGAGAST
jgi:RNA polymerase-interacting CarD/CdnL/TRCF family regulator